MAEPSRREFKVVAKGCSRGPLFIANLWHV